MTTQLEIYEEIAELLATMDPTKVVRLKAPQARQERLEYLLDKNRENTLSEIEHAELERYLLFNRIVGLAKIRAKRMLANEAKNLR